MFHKKEVINTKWNQNNENLFSSSGLDGYVAIWDTSKIGSKISQVEEEDGPCELMQVYHNKSNIISDMNWSKDNLLAFVDDKNFLNVLKKIILV